MNQDPANLRPWFRAKRYGFGAGLPITWQGWAVTLAYVAIVAGFSLMAERRDGSANWAAYGGIGLATALLLWIVAGRTEGGWAWRWGRDEPPPPGRG